MSELATTAGTLENSPFEDPVFRARLAQSPQENPMAAVAHWAGVFGNPLTWKDLPWLRSLTSLPLILKGICHPDDARRALDGGADAIYCSNHGGRQANGGLAAIDLLPDVVAAAGDDIGRHQLLDGCRRGPAIGHQPDCDVAIRERPEHLVRPVAHR